MNKLISKKWWLAAGTRAIKTAAQAALGLFGTKVLLGDVDWRIAGSVIVMAALASLLTSLAGLPEVVEEEEDAEAEG
jgi:hypothetical protein